MTRAAPAILPAREADLPAIAALAGVIWRACYPGIITAEQIEYMLARMYDVETMRRETAAGVRYLRILAGDTLIGFAAWGPAEPSDGRTVAKLHKLYVLPAEHGKGVGSAALAEVESEARAAGFARLILAVNKGNAKAINAYRRNGFAVLRDVCNDIGGGFVMDDHIMAKTLIL